MIPREDNLAYHPSNCRDPLNAPLYILFVQSDTIFFLPARALNAIPTSDILLNAVTFEKFLPLHGNTFESRPRYLAWPSPTHNFSGYLNRNGGVLWRRGLTRFVERYDYGRNEFFFA